MGSRLLFHGKTAIVTGAGGGMGAHYVRDLAARGCNVIINDLGCELNGKNPHTNNKASILAKEIVQKGGKAVPNFESVLDGEKIVEHALKEFGSVDIVINNAGIIRDKSFLKMSEEDWKAVVDTHLHGCFKMCHTAWPLMMKQNYGKWQGLRYNSTRRE